MQVTSTNKQKHKLQTTQQTKTTAYINTISHNLKQQLFYHTTNNINNNQTKRKHIKNQIQIQTTSKQIAIKTNQHY